jgi:hypothetical protein
MQLDLLDGAKLDHSFASSRFALFSSITQLFCDWVLLSPAVAARSSLQVRSMSKDGSLSATVMTSCEPKAIIEIEMGIVVGSAQGEAVNWLVQNNRPRAFFTERPSIRSS